MAVSIAVWWISLALTFSTSLADVVTVCYDSGAVHEGKLSMTGANVIETKRNTRSKLECATLCYSDFECLTAVYRSDGDCLFVKNYTSVLTIEDDSQSFGVLEEILELKSNEYKGELRAKVTCPAECTGYSVCFMDCGQLNDGAMNIEAGCMDISTSQYDIDGCGFRPSIQMKEYYLSNLLVTTSTSGQAVFSVTFVKQYDWTTLQVKFRGTLRAGYGHTTGTWGYWRILFDGSDCTDPGNIESINYNEESNTAHDRASGIIGICYGLTAKSYSITLTTQHGTSTEFRVGYATHASRFYIEEIGQPTWSSEPTVLPCPSLPSFNYREHTTTSTWVNEPSVTLWNFGYTKMEADTWLRINVDLVIRNYASSSSSSKCATWYIKIGGIDCKPWKYGKTLAHLNYANSVNNEHRSTEFEGHCQDVTAGYHTISLYLGTCELGTSYTDIETGWNSNTNRIIIEEFRPNSNIIAVMDSDGETIYRVPEFNMVAHGAGHLDDDTDEGEITTWKISTYNKIYSTSGVKVTMSYGGRVYSGHGNGEYDPCCRHYIKFNGEECTDPGTIEGINYLNKPTNLHRPNMIEGICEGIPAGPVNITIWAGKCKGYSQIGECFFGWDSYQHLLISETFVDREILQY